MDSAVTATVTLTRLRNKGEYTTLPVHLLPVCFTLREAQSVYERILGRTLDKSAFPRRMAEDFVEALPGQMHWGNKSTGADLPERKGRETRFFDRTI
jgi:hypothetical protein